MMPTLDLDGTVFEYGDKEEMLSKHQKQKEVLEQFAEDVTESLGDTLKHTGGVAKDLAETAHSHTTTSAITEIDLADGNFQPITFDQATSLSIKGATDGEASVLVLPLIDANKYTVGLTGCNFDWGDEDAPVLTANCEITAYCYDGSTWHAQFRNLA